MKKRNFVLVCVVFIGLLGPTATLHGGGVWTVPKEPYAFGNERRVSSVEGVPTPTYALWETWDMYGRLVFINGFFSGYILDNSPSEKKKEFFENLGGMSARQIIETIDNFYKDYTHVRDRYPVVLVILSVLPNYRSGKDPLG